MDPSQLAMREFFYSKIDFEKVRSILDLGCGIGSDLMAISKKIAGEARLAGLDSMAKSIAAAQSETEGDSRYSFSAHDLTLGIPFEDASFDLVLSNNLLECIRDKDHLLRETARVLKPGGQVAFAHFDWDSQLFDGNDRQLVRKIVQIFNDWQQPWMTDCDPWMGRRLWRTFQRTGLFEGEVFPYVLINTRFEDPFFGFRRAADFQALVKREMIPENEYRRFYHDLQRMADAGEYFYSITLYIYTGRKR